MSSFSKPFGPPLPPVVRTAGPGQLPLSFLGFPFASVVQGALRALTLLLSDFLSTFRSELSFDLSFPWPSWNSAVVRTVHSCCVSHSCWVIRCTGGLFKNRFPEILETVSQQVWGEATAGLANRYPPVILITWGLEAPVRVVCEESCALRVTGLSSVKYILAHSASAELWGLLGE